MRRPLDKILQQLFGKRKMNPAPGGRDEELLPQALFEYADVIGRYISYFHLLDLDEKKVFIRRCFDFHKSKTFHYIGLAEQKEIPILVSAAAVQITFGLARYKLDFFKRIIIMADAYEYDRPGVPYIGHVAPDGIYLSWKHFLQGYADSTDNVNVAIHEMAHALSHNSVWDESGIDWEFRSDFVKFPAVYGPALANLVTKKRCYLRPYAYSNIQEFWAVSVEAFFENPTGLKDNMPRLYHVISEILNQDLQARHRKTTSTS